MTNDTETPTDGDQTQDTRSRSPGRPCRARGGSFLEPIGLQSFRKLPIQQRSIGFGKIVDPIQDFTDGHFAHDVRIIPLSRIWTTGTLHARLTAKRRRPSVASRPATGR